MPKKITSPQGTTEIKYCGRSFKIHRAKTALILAIAVFVTEFISTHTPAAHLPKVHCSDKTLHLIAYAVLGAVFVFALMARGTRLRKIILAGVIFFPLYGCFDEITQPLVNRSADYYDWRMDMFGSIGMILLIAMCVMIRRKLRRKSQIAKPK